MNKNISYWEQSSFLQAVDFAVIGSGIVGINAALKWREDNSNSKVVVLERGILPAGASTKNAGFACFGSISELVEDMEENGEQMMLDLVRKRWEGLKRLRSKLGDQTINYHEYGGFELFLEAQKEYAKYEPYLSFLNDRLATIIGVKEVFSEVANPNQFGFGKKVRIIQNRVEGQLHPGKMMQALVLKAQEAGITILSGINITGIEEQENQVQLLAATATITAKQVLIATNGFTPRLFPKLAIKPARNQVILTKPIPNLALKGCFHYEQGYYYFRNVGNRILLGGARNKAVQEETTDVFGETPLIQNTLLTFLKEVVAPNYTIEIEHKWSGILGVGTTKKPIVQKLSDRLGVAVRLGGMGVAIGTLVGEEGAALFAN